MTNENVPNYIDGAKVLLWAWAGQNPFGFINYTDSLNQEIVFGLAICKYENDNNVYRFSCDENWETLQDGYYESIEAAIEQLPEQYKNVEVIWQTK